MRDFDSEISERHEEIERKITDRDFKLGGEVFTHRVNISIYELGDLDEEREREGWNYIKVYERSIEQLLIDADKPRFRAMIEKKNLSVSVDDLQTLYGDLLQMAYGRPTEASSLSTGGGANNGASSTATSSTEPAVASAA